MLRSGFPAVTHNLCRYCRTNLISAQKSCHPRQSPLRIKTPAGHQHRSYHQQHHHHCDSSSNKHSRYSTTVITAVALALPASYALGRKAEGSADGLKGESSAFSLCPFSSTSTPEAHSSGDSQATPNSSSNGTNMIAPPIASIPPGRPETLTKAEEAKLKELWAASMRVFGVIEADSVATSSDNTTPEPASAATVPEEPTHSKKKSLGRLLSRSAKRDSHPSATATASSPTAVISPVALDESDDKYGHNKDFKFALASQTPAELREAFWGMVKCDNPDGLLLRFLRARKWDVDKALVMMVATMGWRAKEMNVAKVVRDGETVSIAENDEGFMKQLRMGKSFLHGVDKDGRPICLVRVRLHKQADQSEKSLEKYTIYIMETARLMLRTPVDTACVVFDMTNFSLANMDYAPVKFMIKCFEAHYPESLGICLVHKAPWVFQGVWNIIKGWLDPVVASKIHFTKTTEELEQFIPRSQIIKELGGDEDWEYKYIEPAEGEDVALNSTVELGILQAERDAIVKEYEELTQAWIAASEGAESDEKKRRRMELAKKLETGYWAMDKYLRGRTLYDRTGVLKPDGTLNFYPKKQAPVESQSDDID